MDVQRRTLLGLAMGAVVGASGAKAQTVADGGRVAPPDPTEIIRLWPDGAPGGRGVTVTPVVPERSTDPAFHVVAPDFPGSAFSPPLSGSRVNVSRADYATIFADLMSQLATLATFFTAPTLGLLLPWIMSSLIANG